MFGLCLCLCFFVFCCVRHSLSVPFGTDEQIISAGHPVADGRMKSATVAASSSSSSSAAAAASVGAVTGAAASQRHWDAARSRGGQEEERAPAGEKQGETNSSYEVRWRKEGLREAMDSFISRTADTATGWFQRVRLSASLWLDGHPVCDAGR